MRCYIVHTPERTRDKLAKKVNNPEKKKAWDAFSKYKRILDCIATTGTTVAGRCITCGQKFHISMLQAGHFIAGRSNAVLFNRKFVNAQCRYCNEYNHGKPKVYREAMVYKYGKSFVDRWETKLRGLAKRGAITDRQINWEQRTARYKRLLKVLKARHNGNE